MTCLNCGKTKLHSAVTQGCTCQYAMQAPPQRTWVDLTDEEIQAVAKQARSKDHAVTLTNKFLRDKNT